MNARDLVRIAPLVALALLNIPAVASAQSGSRQTATSVFAESRPGESTGVRLAIDYVNPSDSEAKPPAVHRVVLRLDDGTAIDTSVPALCEASDAQLLASGPSACPAASKVGAGEVDIDTGVPGPGRVLQNDVTLLNNRGELILLLQRRTDPPTRTLVRGKIEGATITSEVPALPGGPPDGFTAVKRVRLNLDPRSTGQGSSRRSYVTTPRRCASGGNWTNTATFTYRDGVSQSVANSSPCTGSSTPPGARADYKPPRIRVTGVPRKRCARRDFTARVRIAERWSGLRRARLSLGRRRLLVRGTKRFSRRIPARRLRSRRHRLTVAAVDRAGNRSVRRVVFRRCRR